jgi:hypothetical protein
MEFPLCTGGASERRITAPKSVYALALLSIALKRRRISVVMYSQSAAASANSKISYSAPRSHQMTELTTIGH